MSDHDDPERYGPVVKPPHWCKTCRGHTGPGSPCHDEPEQELTRCHGVALVCRMQLDFNPETHECKQAGKCIFAPVATEGERE